MIAAETIPHILLDARGRAWIDDSNVKVIEVVLNHLSEGGQSAEQIHADHPHLSLAQIHAALAFYYDNRAAFDEQIARDLREVEELRRTTPVPPWQARLRAERAAENR